MTEGLNVNAMSSCPHLSGSLMPGASKETEPQMRCTQSEDYDRLRVLYTAGRLLARFESVESTFPKLLELCGNTFPITSAVLIERCGDSLVKADWRSPFASTAGVDAAIQNARKSFCFLTGQSLFDSAGAAAGPTSSGKLSAVKQGDVSETGGPSHYIVLPLIVDQLPAFGILQLEGMGEVGEKDVEFVNAMADLIAVAVDRHHKTDLENAQKREEVRAAGVLLALAETHVAELEAEKELRETFVCLLSHDLKNPLTAIKMNAQMMARKNGETFEPNSLSSKIVTDVERADRMICDLLDANRIRSGEALPLHRTWFNLSTLVQETLEPLSLIHGNRFVFAPFAVEGFWDRNGLRRILENLCNNAIKYGSATEPVVLGLSLANGQALLSVTNRGEPILLADQRSLFQQFRRGSKALESGKKGWGIGLTLVRGVAEAHFGSVEVSSDFERGTVFSVSIPVEAHALH